MNVNLKHIIYFLLPQYNSNGIVYANRALFH